ncbi:Guanine-nucleotide exchange factor YEL1 [Candida viswanathii]|uniref:Guanine-nucleotide exchange factor YEL1 n=1 Tax=Candida viswanathii TaxID=5486 RepID=A0A367YHQ9_9ASCO|nr:Guanine-nucleotide exchange factor YEL1 [Candida viswanathii]
MSIDSVESMVSAATNLSDSTVTTVTTTTTPNSSINMSKPPPIKTTGKANKQAVKEDKPLPITPTSETQPEDESSLSQETDPVNPPEEQEPERKAEATSTTTPKEEVEDADAEYKLIAQRLFDEDFVSIKPAEYTQFLAAGDKDSTKIRTYYMSYFKWSPNLLKSTRILCSKLYLKGESQEIDRILSSFTKSYIRQHKENPFYTRNFEQIYIVIYSLILLNTALHNAELDKKSRISKHDFIKNTLETFVAQNKKNSLGIKQKIAIENELSNYYEDIARKELNLKSGEATTPSQDQRRMSKISRSEMPESPEQNTLTRQPSASSMWSHDTTAQRRSSFSLQRHPTSSTEMSASRKPSRVGLARTLAGGGNGAAGDQKMYSQSNNSMVSQMSRRTSFDQILGRSKPDFNLLGDEELLEEPSIEYDEEDLEKLELEGAPFLKEGLVMYKEVTTEKRSIFHRASATNFASVFVVVSRGDLLIFSFDEKLKRKKSVVDDDDEGELGDGNWLKSSVKIGSYSLIAALAEQTGDSLLVTIPNHKSKLLFKAGTQESSEEFAQTINYWAAVRTAVPAIEDSLSSVNFGFNNLELILQNKDIFKKLKISKYQTVVPGVNQTNYPIASQFVNTVHYTRTLQEKLKLLKEQYRRFAIELPACSYQSKTRAMITSNYETKIHELEVIYGKYKSYVIFLGMGLAQLLKTAPDNTDANVKELLSNMGFLNDKKMETRSKNFDVKTTGFESPLHSLMVIEEENSSE